MSDDIGLDVKNALSRKIAIEMGSFLEDKYKNDILIDENHQFNIKFFDLMTDIFLKIFYTLSEEKSEKVEKPVKRNNKTEKSKKK